LHVQADDKQRDPSPRPNRAAAAGQSSDRVRTT
jgi:hypothetical protein